MSGNRSYSDYADLPTKLEIAGLIIGVLTFAISLRKSSVETVGGRVVASSYFDSAAVLGGAIVLLIGLAALVTLIRNTAEIDRIGRFGILLVLVALGIIHLLRGFGVIFSPVPAVGSTQAPTARTSLDIVFPSRTRASASAIPTLAPTVRITATRLAITHTPRATMPMTPTATTVLGANIIQDVTLTRRIYPGGQLPISPTHAFEPTDEYLHAVVQLQWATRLPLIKAVWYAVAVTGQAPNTKLKETVLPEQAFTYPRLFFYIGPQTAWAAGTYAVEIYVNDELARRVDFSVSASAATRTPVPPLPTPAPMTSFAFVKDVVMAQGADPKTYEPIGVTTTFTREQKSLYVFVRLDKAPAYTTFKFTWYALPSSAYPITVRFAEYSHTFPGEYTGNFVNHIDADAPIPEGPYRVEVYVNQKLARVLDFTVSK
jgi:hypothetical protein